MNNPYRLETDPVIAALITEASADPEVIGLVLTGSRAVGGVTTESDYDVAFVVSDPVLARYEATARPPPRGATITPPISTTDIWHVAPSTLQLGTVEDWMLPAWAESVVLYDRTGATTQIIDALRRMPADHAQAAVATWYDAYLNSLYRSLKAWRRGNALGARLEAAESANYLLHLLFALECHWRPYSSRLLFHLNKLHGQGWQPDEFSALLIDLIATGEPQGQQRVARRVAALLQERGYGYVYDGWEGQIDQVLAWDYPV